MSIAQLQVIAGTISTVIFVSSNLPMLQKALRTREMASYSLEQIALSNIGNVIYWLYVVGLPVGPVWFLHGFFTAATALMLIFYLRYEKGWGGRSPFLSANNPNHRRDARLILDWQSRPGHAVERASWWTSLSRRVCLRCAQAG